MTHKRRKTILGIGVALMLAGCAAPGTNAPRPLVSSVSGTGNTLPATSRMTIDIAGPWNRMILPNAGPAQIWTMEGMPIDQLLVYAGLKDDQAIHGTSANTNAKVKAFKFRSTMQPDEIVALFEGMLTRDGSRFTLVKLEPSSFGIGIGTGTGFRFEFELVRRISNLTMRGVGYGTVSQGELFSMLYVAPRLNFYSRHIATVEKISASAVVKE
jgi:hypothetical protein